ncbi:sigma54 specific transcriptional regulator, Fis family [Denitrovibrio acetiphilus DSM 12809]|uniref:Sigma54 specific transcriptional regulator, Fis family n=1 Tax=Denitrovibrio acetiphilus (strain DSM 12809 / NBRC 114555 / N2460) TaxID=522772 RepID=D4H8J8_DENA2|nr:sigma-54-dependent Fis family transcriptional regulator [Denitrovibrio acetiphilus]ADD68347.1 sigma54 specific transcriptional regulator, Fis family [Denitrovibrio acetiphilus DSM 12809]
MNLGNRNISELLKVNPETKIITFLDRRVLIDDSISQGLLRKELIQIFGKYGAKNVLTRYGYAHGWRTAEMLKKESPDLFYGSHGGAYLHMLYGIVFTTRLEQTDGMGDAPLIHSKLEYSYEAEQHILHFGVADEPICWTLTGFASGYESFKNSRDVYFIETKCVGKGDDYCEIEGRFAEKWGDDLTEHLPFYGMASTNDILQELSSQIHFSEKKLIETKNKLKNLELKKNCSGGMVVRSKKMQEVTDLAHRAARVNTTILICGESGVGKEVLARYIHSKSPDSDKPFVAVNCGAFSESLLESELFGHAKGSFTGAEKEHKGLFEEAEGGTLFLDEIGETSKNMQVKLLRVIQEKEIRRVGENQPRKINLRIISATNKNLEKEVQEGNFRKDLFYRLNVINIKIPPLCQRTEDILPLAHCFIKSAAEEMNVQVTGIAPSASEALLRYNWPGNVRELHNVIHRAAALADSSMIEENDLPPELLTSCSAPSTPISLAEMEKEHIRNCLIINNGDKKRTAQTLNIGIATLYRKIKEYQL